MFPATSIVETAAFFPAKTLLSMYWTFSSAARRDDKTEARTPTRSRCRTLTCEVPSPAGDWLTQFRGDPCSKLVMTSRIPCDIALLA